MTASVFISETSGMKFLTNFLSMSSTLHSSTVRSPSTDVLSWWNLRSASPLKGIAAISALKLCMPTANTLSSGKCSVPPMLTGMFILPKACVATVVFACRSTSIWSSCSWIWRRSRPSASVSSAMRPATNMLSTSRPILLRALFCVFSFPSNPALLRSMSAKTVSLLSV